MREKAQISNTLEQPEQRRPRVFISYSQHDPAHSQRVREIADVLAADGIDVELDQYHQNEPIDWPRWCEERLRPENSDFVLMICSGEYKRRIENRAAANEGFGVSWEGNLIYNYLYKAKANERFIPVLIDNETRDSLPQIVAGWMSFSVRVFGVAGGDPGYARLYRTLTAQPAVPKPSPGPIKFLPREILQTQEYAETGRSAQKGLEALIKLMRDGAVREDMGRFEAHFESSAKQIDELSYYKHLHDQLHTLQLGCYQRLTILLRDVKTSPEDSSAWEEAFDESEMLLRDGENGLGQLSDPDIISERGVSWVPKLIDTIRQVSQALQNHDTEVMETAYRTMGRILRIEPDRLNSKLRGAARALPLAELVASLSRVCDRLNCRPTSPIALAPFKEGVAALGKLAERLKSLVAQHDVLQKLDVELMRIEAEGLTKIENSWLDLRADSEAEWQGITEEWAHSLAGDAEKLTQAIAAGNPNVMERYFRRFRTGVSHQFLDTDKNLKELCGELARVGGPLAKVLEFMNE
jgi:TIR domain